MSKAENKRRSLDDLLKKSGSEADDAFEKEAREGFEMLENVDEAFALKASTDARINKEVFAPKRERTVFYWVAAASILLFVSFSIYFFKDVPVNEAPLVSNDLKKESEIHPQTTQPVLSEKIPEVVEKKTELQIQSGAGVKSKSTIEQSGEKEEEPQLLDQMAGKSADPQPAPETASPQLAANSAPVEEKDTKSDDRFSSPQGASEIERPAEERSRKKSAKAFSEGATAPQQAAYDRSETSTSITYPGGNSELKKILKEKLQKENVDMKFSATLYIDPEGKVERAEFSQNNDLSKQEKKKISEQLLTLKNFRVLNPGNNAITYDLQYVP